MRPSLARQSMIAACAFATALPATASTPVTWNTRNGQAPIAIGHRGASGYLPEQTLASHALARAQSQATGRTVGIYPEPKHSTCLRAQAEANGISATCFDDTLVSTQQAAYTQADMAFYLRRPPHRSRADSTADIQPTTPGGLAVRTLPAVTICSNSGNHCTHKAGRAALAAAR